MHRSLLPLGLLLTSACTVAPTSSTGPIPRDIYLPEAVLDFGEVELGQEVTRTLTIHNAGDASLALQGLRFDRDTPENFSMPADEEIPSSIPPRSRIDLPITLLGGELEESFGAIEIFTNDPDEPERTVGLIALPEAHEPEAAVSATLLDYGFVFEEDTSSLSVLLLNEGVDPLGFQWELSEGDAEGFEVTLAPAFDTLEPGTSTLFEVGFTPVNLQEAVGRLRITTDDRFHPELTVHLQGNGPGAQNNTPPSASIVSPSTSLSYETWEQIPLSIRVFDEEQPAGSLYVEVFSSIDGLIANGVPDSEGVLELPLSPGEDELSSGLHTLTVSAFDARGLSGTDVTVFSIGFPLSASDTDGDGYDANQGDCDDSDASVFPQAVELLDGQDNDCDGMIDESTEASDDDGDGFSEAEGDCDDRDEYTFPGQAETQDFLDNNCDGVVDEGTLNYDDDGDGFSEAQGDCRDDDPETHSFALEYCNDTDNDCDGVPDDDCVRLDVPPRIIGGVIADRSRAQASSLVDFSVFVISPDDPANLSYAWESDGGEFVADTDNDTVTWRAPAESGLYTLQCTVTDSFGNVAWEFGDIIVSITSTPNTGASASSCSTAPVGSRGAAPGSVVLGLLGLLLLRRRR